MTEEIMDGKPVVRPRPPGKHIYAASGLDRRLGLPYEFGISGMYSPAGTPAGVPEPAGKE